MKKKLLLVLGTGALAILMSSCFLLQSFTILDYTVARGQLTKARFNIRPSHEDPGAQLRAYQFVLVGVTTPDISVGKAVWGSNSQFNGPLTMGANGAIATSIGSDCSSNGLNYNSITGITWKGYLTPQKINDRGLVEKKAVVDVNIKAKASASVGSSYTVMGIAGAWTDVNDDQTVDPGDSFICWGIGTSGLYVKS
jgi:hypothetical protein